MSMHRMPWVLRRVATCLVFWNTKPRYWTVSLVRRDYAGEKLEESIRCRLNGVPPTFVC